MLEIKDLSVIYSDKKVAVENFSLLLEKGKIISIVGESGSGKSTVMLSILGLLPNGGKIISGDILYEGKSLLKLDNKEWLNIRGTEITMISQDSGGTLNPIRKIGKQYVEYILAHENISRKEAEKKAVLFLEKVNLSNPENVMKSYPHQLSGGMKQRVGIAMALTFSPKIILADEPTSALDVTTQAQIVKEIMELREELETGILLITHNIGVASYMSDEIIVMQNGKIVDRGSRDEVIYNPGSSYTKKLLNSVPEMEGERLV